MKRLLKGLAVFAVFAAVVLAPKTVKADYQDCLQGNHVWFKDITLYQPTCTAPGVNIYTCMVCSKHEQRIEIPSLGHVSNSGSLVIPNDANGFVVYRCSRCGTYLNETSIPQEVSVYNSISAPYVQSPLQLQPTAFDPNLCAVVWIPYHSVVSVNGVAVNFNAIGAQPLAPFMTNPGKYEVTVVPNTTAIHADQNSHAFVVTKYKDATKPLKVVQTK